ncbi:MAG: replication-associated recombination protein A [Candidatus Saccharimonadales bacterium]
MESTYTPLAEQMRPQELSDFIGQEHLLGPDGLVRQLAEQKQLSSLILWGPPGSGKTTLARILAQITEADFVEVSAVTARLEDVRQVIKRAEENQRLQLNTILFVDEIHRFNKAQQDAFLPHVESGLITLIGATTENPSFEVIRPLLSRSRVLVLEPLKPEEIKTIVRSAAKRLKSLSRLSSKGLEYLVEVSAGDARTALNTLELSLQISQGKQVTPKIVKTAAQTRIPGFDKAGEMHYNLISAFIKSLRGSDIDASLYYLARMLAAGEDPKFIARRLVIFASEDIGIAVNGALNLAVATFEAVERIGLPEAQYSLFHCASVLARSPKSRAVADAMGAALQAAKAYPDAPVPLHVRNAPTQLMKDLGYGQDYKWQADFKPEAGFLPQELEDTAIWPAAE